MKHKIGFIGLGLIGGSIAKAIRQYYPDYEIVAFDKNKESLALATQESMIDVAATTIDNNFQNCNYIFLCAPVAYNTAYLKQLTEYLNHRCRKCKDEHPRRSAESRYWEVFHRGTSDGRIREKRLQ